MKKSEVNELEEFERPYEIEYSSLKSSKNESLKMHQDKLKQYNKNILEKNNTDKNMFVNNPNLNSVNSFKSISNKNYRLNENTKKNLENFIESNKNKIQKNNKKVISKINNDKNMNKKAHNNKNNNSSIYSKINNYWENHEKKNKIRMNIIKKEREKKIYGELLEKPKISKNSQDIIERLKERTYELTAEDEFEDEINRNIPVKTKEKNYFFKTVYYSNKIKLKNKIKEPGMNKSISKIKTKIYNDNEFTVIKNNKKRAKTPRVKRNNYFKLKQSKISAADIKNIEVIKKLRKKEEEEKMEEIEEKIKEEETESSPDKNKKQKLKIKKMNNNISLDKKINNYLNKSMNSISMRNSNLNLNYISNINEIMTSRRYLNEIYNKDKKIINHSFILSYSNKNIPNSSSQINVPINDNNNFTFNHKKSKTFDGKIQPKTNKSKNEGKNLINYGSYDPISKSFKYKHYTEISKSNSNIKSNSIQYNDKDDKIENIYNNEIKNIYISTEGNNKSKINQNNNINRLKNNLVFEFDRELNDKKKEENDLYNLYKKDIKYRTKEINKLENELKEKNLINNKLINELNIEDKEFLDILRKNEAINNKFNKIDNISLLKYREENRKNLQELNKKNNKYDINKMLYNKKVEEEEEKNMYNYIEAENKTFKNINNFKNNKTFLNNMQQKIENKLDLYNNELKINETKKGELLSKIYGENYSKSIADDNKSELNFGVNKYLINNDINESSQYKYNYSSFNNNNEMNNEDLFNNENSNLIEDFDFQRKHLF